MARQFRGEEEAIFAATPPLEALKLLLSMAVSGNENRKLGVLDVSRAFFNADITEETYVELPDELKVHHPGMCWRLKKAMYGTRAAANSWAKEYTSKLLSWHFERGRSTPCIFPSRPKNNGHGAWR